MHRNYPQAGLPLRCTSEEPRSSRDLADRNTSRPATWTSTTPGNTVLCHERRRASCMGGRWLGPSAGQSCQLAKSFGLRMGKPDLEALDRAADTAPPLDSL